MFQIMKSEVMRISHELQAQKEKIKENAEKIKVNKTLPYLVSNVIEVRTFFSTTCTNETHLIKLQTDNPFTYTTNFFFFIRL